MNKFQWFTILFWIVISITSVTAQDSHANVALTLERTACHGTCPIYSVTVLEDGNVIYEGENFVSVTGKQTSEIPAETVVLMVEAFNDAGYFGWNEAYDTQTVSDLPTVITSVSRDGITHRIERYAGDYTAPITLPFLEQWIDAMANTSLWTGVQPDISDISNGTDMPLVTLEREPNFGLGPVYNIAAYEDGTVVYMGIANVNKIGVQVSQTDPVAITSVGHRAQLSGYFNWKDSYEERIITDQATITTSIQWADQFKRIVRYDGDPNAPVGIVWVEDNIDQLVTDLES